MELLDVGDADNVAVTGNASLTAGTGVMAKVRTISTNKKSVRWRILNPRICLTRRKDGSMLEAETEIRYFGLPIFELQAVTEQWIDLCHLELFGHQSSFPPYIEFG